MDERSALILKIIDLIMGILRSVIESQNKDD